MTFRWKIAQWFELRWWRSYLSDKDKKLYLEWKKNYWKNLLSKLPEGLVVDREKRIVDLGCGPAGVFVCFPENIFTAVDSLIETYEEQTSFFDRKEYPNTAFINSSIEDFHSTERFDVVFCMNAINHVSDIKKGFDQLKALCVDNGVVILSIDVHNYSFLRWLFRLIPGDILHPHQYNLKEYQSFLKIRGLEILATELLKTEFVFNHYLIVAKK